MGWNFKSATRMDNTKSHDTEAYLARIRRTIAESNRLVDQVELRIRETDRALEAQGLTREQVMGIRLSDEQRVAMNRELARLGIDPRTVADVMAPDVDAGQEVGAPKPVADARREDVASQSVDDAADDLAHRRMKFGLMMKPFQI